MKKDIITVRDLSPDDIEHIFTLARAFEKNTRGEDLSGRSLIYAFFEPSTRTLLSFITAAQQLGAHAAGFSTIAATSLAKGESFPDTIRMLENYGDVLILRHSQAGKAQEAAALANIPVINAGDGDHEHPTQALVDLYTIRKQFPTLAGITVGLAGDLKFSRSMHSLVGILHHYGVHFVFISPEGLSFPSQYISAPFKKASNLSEAIAGLDVLYMQRLQKERFPPGFTMSSYKEEFVVTPTVISRAKKTLMILDPLPRIDELDTACDSLPQAWYFKQAANSVPVRKALLCHILGRHRP